MSLSKDSLMITDLKMFSVYLQSKQLRSSGISFTLFHIFLSSSHKRIAHDYLFIETLQIQPRISPDRAYLNNCITKIVLN